jgi:hypothetical protein
MTKSTSMKDKNQRSRTGLGFLAMFNFFFCFTAIYNHYLAVAFFAIESAILVLIVSSELYGDGV